MSTIKRTWFRFSLRWLLFEIAWITLAIGFWVLLCHANHLPLALPVIAFYCACGAAIGGLVYRAGWGAVIGAVFSSIMMVAIYLWPPTDL